MNFKNYEEAEKKETPGRFELPRDEPIGFQDQLLKPLGQGICDGNVRPVWTLHRLISQKKGAYEPLKS